MIRGTRWPTWMKAGWLSSVMICGRLRTSRRRHSCKARSSTLTLSLEAESTRPPKPSSLFVRPTAKFDKPWRADAARAVRWSLPLLPSGWLLKLKPGVNVGRDDLLVLRGRIAAGRRRSSCVNVVNVAQQAAVEEHRVLQAQLDAELVGVAQVDLGDQHLDHHHRRPLRRAPRRSS